MSKTANFNKKSKPPIPPATGGRAIKIETVYLPPIGHDKPEIAPIKDARAVYVESWDEYFKHKEKLNKKRYHYGKFLALAATNRELDEVITQLMGPNASFVTSKLISDFIQTNHGKIYNHILLSADPQAVHQAAAYVCKNFQDTGPGGKVEPYSQLVYIKGDQGTVNREFKSYEKANLKFFVFEHELKKMTEPQRRKHIKDKQTSMNKHMWEEMTSPNARLPYLKRGIVEIGFSEPGSSGKLQPVEIMVNGVTHKYIIPPVEGEEAKGYIVYKNTSDSRIPHHSCNIAKSHQELVEIIRAANPDLPPFPFPTGYDSMNNVYQFGSNNFMTARNNNGPTI